MMQAERRRPVSNWAQRGDAQRGEMISRKTASIFSSLRADSQKVWRAVRGENKACAHSW